MAHGAWPQLFHLGRQTVCALAVLVAVLAIGLAQPGHVADRGGVPSLEAHDAYAKALRPLPQLAYRGQSRSARLGSSVGAEPFLLASCSVPLTRALTVANPAPRRSGSTGFLEQCTRCPREPPPSIA
jgi:hypothetical protein